MASAWSYNGPIAIPSRGVAYGAAALLVVLAVAAGLLGFQAAFRPSGAPGLAEAGAAQGADDTLPAKPIVELPAPVKAADDSKAAADSADSADTSDDDSPDAKTAAAQALQSKGGKSPGDIDNVLASPTEKPPAPVKAPTDEAPPPSAPVKSDVPF